MEASGWMWCSLWAFLFPPHFQLKIFSHPHGRDSCWKPWGSELVLGIIMLLQSVCLSSHRTQVVNTWGNIFLTPQFLMFQLFCKIQFHHFIVNISKSHRMCEGVQIGYVEIPKPELKGRHRMLFPPTVKAGVRKLSPLRAFVDTAREWHIWTVGGIWTMNCHIIRVSLPNLPI